jgi:hypothetical protein
MNAPRTDIRSKTQMKQKYQISDPPFLNPVPYPGEYRNDPVDEVLKEMTKPFAAPIRTVQSYPMNQIV